MISYLEKNRHRRAAEDLGQDDPFVTPNATFDTASSNYFILKPHEIPTRGFGRPAFGSLGGYAIAHAKCFGAIVWGLVGQCSAKGQNSGNLKQTNILVGASYARAKNAGSIVWGLVGTCKGRAQNSGALGMTEALRGGSIAKGHESGALSMSNAFQASCVAKGFNSGKLTYVV